MRHTVLFLLATAALAGDYALPGPGSVVLRLSESPLLGKPTPVIEVYADGRIRHRKKGKFEATRLTKAELQDLLRFAIETHDFFKYDAAAVKRALKARETGGHCGTGFITTHITLAIRGRKKHASVGMLTSRAGTIPEIRDLVHLHAIYKRLHVELLLARSGGRARVASYLEAANLRLKQRHPEVEPFTLEDFRGVKRIPEANLILPEGWDPNLLVISGDCARFMRRIPGKVVHATVRTDPQAKPRAAAHAE